MSHRTLNLTDNLYEYMLSVSLREHPILTELREETSNWPEKTMQISPEQGQFMALLIELTHAKKVIEIGVYTGYSSLTVALALPEDGHLLACDVSDTWTTVARKFWKKAEMDHKITLKLAPALKTLDQLIANQEHEQYDFVFIDADKINYQNYYEKALVLLKKNGFILIDNVLWNGAVADASVQDPSTNVIRGLNEKIYADTRVTMSLLPIGDGLTLVRKR